MSKSAYTPEITSALVAAYVAAKSDSERGSVMESFADQIGVKTASVRQKLVREGVYVKKAAATRSAKRERKDAIVAQHVQAMESLGVEIPDDGGDCLGKLTHGWLAAYGSVLSMALKSAE